MPALAPLNADGRILRTRKPALAPTPAPAPARVTKRIGAKARGKQTANPISAPIEEQNAAPLSESESRSARVRASSPSKATDSLALEEPSSSTARSTLAGPSNLRQSTTAMNSEGRVVQPSAANVPPLATKALRFTRNTLGKRQTVELQVPEKELLSEELKRPRCAPLPRLDSEGKDEQPSRLNILAAEAVRQREEIRLRKLNYLVTEAVRRLEEMPK